MSSPKVFSYSAISRSKKVYILEGIQIVIVLAEIHFFVFEEIQINVFEEIQIVVSSQEAMCTSTKE